MKYTDTKHSAIVGEYIVPLRFYKFPTIASFKAGAHGKQIGERGDFCFWTAVLKRPRKEKGSLVKGIWGRAIMVLQAGDRFDRMKGHTAYDKHWNGYLNKGKNIAFIRPSNEREVLAWCISHLSDAKYLFRVIINGKIVSNRRTGRLGKVWNKLAKVSLIRRPS